MDPSVQLVGGLYTIPLLLYNSLFFPLGGGVGGVGFKTLTLRLTSAGRGGLGF